MANEQNLKPLNKRTKSEQREIAKKGGVASGIARRKKADLKAAIEIALTSDIVKDGVTMTGEAAVVSSLLAIATDPKNRSAVSAITLMAKLTGQDHPEQEDDNDMVREFIMALRGDPVEEKGE